MAGLYPASRFIFASPALAALLHGSLGLVLVLSIIFRGFRRDRNSPTNPFSDHPHTSSGDGSDDPRKDQHAQQDDQSNGPSPYAAVSAMNTTTISVFKDIRNEKGEIVDLEWVSVNHVGEQQLQENTSLQGKRYKAINGGHFPAEMFHAYLEAYESGRPVDREFEFVSDGRKRWYRSIAVKSADGLTVIEEDITARKLAEQALLEKTLLVESLTGMMPDVVALFAHPSRELQFLNKKPLIAAGMNPDGLVQMTSAERGRMLIHPEDQIAYQDFLDRVETMPHTGVETITCRIQPPDSDMTWMLIRATVIERDPGGTPIRSMLIFQDITAQKTAEQKLSEQSDSIRRIVENIPETIFIFDLYAKQSVFVNKEVLNLVGYTPEEVRQLGSDVVRFLMHPDDYEKQTYLIADLNNYRDGEVQESVSRMRHKNGQWKTVQTRRAVFRRDSDGTVQQSIAIMRDITQLKEAEIQIKRKNEELELNNFIFRQSEKIASIGTSTIETASGSVFYTDNLFRLFGLEPNDHERGREILKFILRDENESLTPDNTVQHHLQPALTEFQIPQADGEIRYYRHVSNDLITSGGRRYVIGVTQDISLQKKAEEKIKDQARFIATITEAIPDVVSVTSYPMEQTLYINMGPFSMHGFHTEELLGMSLEDRVNLIHTDDQAAFNAFHTSLAALRDEEVATLEYRAKNKNGEWLWLRVRTKVFERNQQGQVVSIVNVLQNIGPQKKAEEELLALRLAQQKEIMNAIIVAQEQERQRIGEALHDGVAQLLYAVQMRLQLLGSETDEKYVAEAKSILVEAIRDTRNISFELVPVILKDYGIQTALEALFQRIAKNNLELDFNCEGMKERLPEKIEFAVYRIVQELVNNIIRHSQATVCSVVLTQEGDEILIDVSDNGVGFEEKKVAMHKGIGLQNIRNRVSLLGGQIFIRSELNKGTVVEIRIPLI